MSKKMIPFGYYGGKFSHLGWLLPLLPPCQHFCEVFGGSGVVLMNRDPSPVETYNDIDGEVVNFFRVLRDETEELKRLIGLTPFSRDELGVACGDTGQGVGSIERARQFFVRARQVRTGLAQTASRGRWAHCNLTSRSGMAGAVSRWLGSVEGLSEVAQRLLRVQIENDDALAVIGRYDSAGSLFYLDPPYCHQSRSDVHAYAHEMDDDQHRSLSDTLHNIRGKAAISGYHCPLMDELYAGWTRHDAPEKLCNSSKTPRREALWTNY